MDFFQSINPSNGKVIANHQLQSKNSLDKIVVKVNEAFISWRSMKIEDRCKCFKEASELLIEKKDELSIIMANEMGKPISQGMAEIEKCSFVCKYYSDNAKSFLNDKIVETDASKSYVSYQPLGIILGIMPWNFPFWQVFRFIAPTMIAGNTVLLKHAPNVQNCAIAIEKILLESGFPQNCYKNIIISHQDVSSLIQDFNIKAVSFTGSTLAGRDIAKQSGKVLKKNVLELGGNDAYIVLKDADIDLAASCCATGRLLNAGQSCIAAKRFIVENDVKEQFQKKLISIMEQQKVGYPLDAKTTIGPLASKKAKKILMSQISKSIDMGAKLIFESDYPQDIDQSSFHPVSVLTNVKKGMPAYHEELFGPVASIINADNEREAIRLANDTIFGLGSAIFTKDVKKGEYIAKNEIESGSAFVNDFVRSDPRLPFGGIKASGYGNELSSYGILEFVNTKTIYIK